MNPPDYDLTQLKVPPHSQDAEEALIAAVLRDSRCLDDVTEIITCADFFTRDGRTIFAAIESLARRSESIDAITVWEELATTGQESMRDTLFRINGEPGGSGFATAYATSVYNRARERELILAGNAIADLGYGEGELAEKIGRAQQLVMTIGETEAEGLVHSNEGLRNWVNTLEERQTNGGALTGLSTGFTDIDRRTHGLQKADLIIVAGRPSMGKTTYAVNIAEHAAIANRHPVLFFSMEMPVNQLWDKINSSQSGIPLERLQRGTVQDEDWEKLNPAIRKAKDAPLYIDGRSSLHISQMQATARRLHRKVGLALVVVDYIQLGRGDGQNHEQEVGSISRGLKAIAKDLNIPVIGISQLSRKCEERANKRPIPSDLRDSGAIEQDADIIQFVYRDEVYNESSIYEGIAEINTAKYRNGRIGLDRLTTRLEVSRFDNFIGEVPQEAPKPMRKVSGFND